MGGRCNVERVEGCRMQRSTLRATRPVRPRSMQAQSKSPRQKGSASSTPRAAPYSSGCDPRCSSSCPKVHFFCALAFPQGHAVAD
eukprot:scaffold1940_cov112-Isochrysis_galbana.AAC.3